MDLHHLIYQSSVYHVHQHALFALSMLLSWSFLQLAKNELASKHFPTMPLISGMVFHYMLKKHIQLKTYFYSLNYNLP